MRKFTSLMLLLLFAVTANAIDVTVIDKASDATTYGALSGTTFTTNDASGLSGLTVSGSSVLGTTPTSFAYGACLSLTSTSSGTVTISAPDGYIITGYSLLARSNTYRVSYTLTPAEGGSAQETSTTGVTLSATGLSTQTTSFTYSASEANSFYIPSLTVTVVSATSTLVNVTYNLYNDDDLSTIVATETKVQEEGSEVAIPAGMVNATYFTYQTTGTIGSEDCTISVVRTPKDDVVFPFSRVTNFKSYYLETARGFLGTSGSQMVSTNGTSFTKSQFAIVYYEGKYYLYSVSDAKFVTATAQPALTTTGSEAAAFDFEATDAPFFFISTGGLGVNMASGYYTTENSSVASGIVINSYTTRDPGNQYVIHEGDDFDPTNAIAMLTDRTPYFEALNELITNAETIIGTALGQYSKSATYDEALASAKSVYANSESTISQLTDAANTLSDAVSAGELNMPQPNTFLRIHSAQGANAYLKAAAASSRMTVTTTADKSTIFLLTLSGKLVAYTNGIAINNVREIGTLAGDASSFTVVEALNGGLGQYSLGATFNGDTNYLYSTGVDGSNADRNTYNTSFINNNSFTLEEVTELPFTISAAGQATLSLPVAWKVPAGVTVRKATRAHDNLLTLEDADVTAVAAGEAVVLVGTPGEYTIELADEGEVLGSVLTATELGGSAVAAETKAYVLALQGEEVVFALLADDDRNIASFKAYFVLEDTGNTDAPQYLLLDDVTAIGSVQTAAPAAQSAYDLQGRRVSTFRPGIYIVNGQKVLVK